MERDHAGELHAGTKSPGFLSPGPHGWTRLDARSLPLLAALLLHGGLLFAASRLASAVVLPPAADDDAPSFFVTLARGGPAQVRGTGDEVELEGVSGAAEELAQEDGSLQLLDLAAAPLPSGDPGTEPVAGSLPSATEPKPVAEVEPVANVEPVAEAKPVLGGEPERILEDAPPPLETSPPAGAARPQPPDVAEATSPAPASPLAGQAGAPSSAIDAPANPSAEALGPARGAAGAGGAGPRGDAGGLASAGSGPGAGRGGQGTGRTGRGGAALGGSAADDGLALRPRSTPRPDYPKGARRRGEEGTVLCRLRIERSGRVLAVEVVEGSGFEELDQAAVAALKRWRFEPLGRLTDAASAYALQRLTFRLKERSP